MAKLDKIAEKINLPLIICNHLFGEKHSHIHRMSAGMVVMTCGVLISKSAGDVHYVIVHLLADGIGYMIHGIGAVPYIEYLIAQAKTRGD